MSGKPMTSPTFYSDIDPGIRDLVQWLRDRGFNTTCACQGGEGHSYERPTVEIDLMNLDEAERLALAVAEFGATTFRIDASIQCPEKGFWARRATVTLGEWMPLRSAKSRGGAAGARARAAALSPERRSEIAAKAADTRWGNLPPSPPNASGGFKSPDNG
jgi:hypothetical protein